MKKTIHAIAALSLVLASTSFAFSLADTTILGKDYAKLTRCSDLNKVRDWTSEGKVVNVIVMNDIDCGNAEFKPIGQSESKAFEGVFDGNGKTISKMKILHNAEYFFQQKQVQLLQIEQRLLNITKFFFEKKGDNH